MNSILLAALGGGLGGGLGALIGVGFDRLRRRPSRASLYLGAALAAAGAGLANLGPGPPPSIEAQLDAAGPAFRAVHRYYPDVFAQMAADARGLDPKDQIALQNRIRPRLSALVAEHRAEMDDTSVNSLGRLMLAETQALQAKSPQSCVAILGGGGETTVDMGAAMPPDLIRQDAAATAQLIEQVATHPARPPPKLSDAEKRGLVDQSLKELSADEQKAVLPLLQQRKTPSSTDEARAYCAFYRALFTTAIRGPDQMLRRFLAG